MKRIATLVLFLLCFNLIAADQPLLVEPQWLKDHTNDANLVLLQVGYLRYDYDKEHIENARFLWPELLAPNSPEGNFNVPDLQTATHILQELGVNKDSHIVLYHTRNEVSVTARMFLTLEHLGFRGKVSYLNGGLDAWKNAGLPVTNKVPGVKKGNATVKIANYIVDRNYVNENISSNKAVIVDARAKRFYDGEPTGYPRDGHIKNALNIPYTDLVNNANKFKPLDSLASYFSPVPDKQKEVVTYCFIGQTASVVYMAGRLLGYDMKLYDGSMQEWSRIEELPMEKTEKNP